MKVIPIIIAIAIPTVWFIIRRVLPAYYRLSEMAEKPFVCPNCGHRIYVKWYKLIFKEFSIHVNNNVLLKCPKCKIKDMCSRPSID